jgi:hypothetical protein
MKTYFMMNKEINALKTILLNEFEKISIPYVKWQSEVEPKLNEESFFKILNDLSNHCLRFS